MKPRVNYLEVGVGAMKAMFGLSRYVNQCGLEQSLLSLLEFRVSQINGCAYCLDMHSKDLRAAGETEQRLCVLRPGVRVRFIRTANGRRSPGPRP